MRHYTRLCLNGGGVRGGLQVGALCAYANCLGTPYLHTVFTDGVHGISVGALICVFIAFGFSIDEMSEIQKSVDVTNMIAEPRLGTLLDFSSKKGLDSGDKIHTYLRNAFTKKGLDFDTLTVGDALIPLRIVASDISRSKYVIFYEKVLLWDAVRASISLPMVFTPHVIKKRVFVDGAISCPHILLTVPVSKRQDTLLLQISNIQPTDIENADAFTFMTHVMSVRTNALVYKLLKEYPENICLLIENNTDMLDLNLDKQHLFNVGHELGSAFFAKCSS